MAIEQHQYVGIYLHFIINLFPTLRFRKKLTKNKTKHESIQSIFIGNNLFINLLWN